MTQVDDQADNALLKTLSEAIYLACGGTEAFTSAVTALFRQAFDEVIDAPRTGRFTIKETEKTEKTYLGTKVEILLRYVLKLPRGEKLDLKIDSIEVDVKNTMGRNWSIPPESLGHPALLTRANEGSAKCDVGLIVVKDAYLNPGRNRDGKRSISTLGRDKIHWLLKDRDYPENFWEALPTAQRHEILNAGTGSARVAKLFEMLQDRRISRNQIQALAQQLDYMKRVRRNGGARDILAPKGIALLWGRKDRDLIAKLGLGAVESDQFISHRPIDATEQALLRDAGHID